MRIPQGIPPLRGAARGAVTAFWAIVFVVTLICSTWGFALTTAQAFRITDACARIGLRCDPRPKSLVLAAPLSAALAGEGISDGQKVISIDGKPVADGFHVDANSAMLQGSEGSAVTVRLRDPSGRVSDHRLIRREATAVAGYAPLGMSRTTAWGLFTAWGAVVAFGSLGMAGLLFLRSHGAAAPIVLSLGLMLVIADDFGPAFGSAGLYAVLMFGNVLGGMLLTISLFLFPASRFEPRWTFPLVAVAPFVWAYLYFGGVRGTPYMSVMLGFELAALISVIIRYRGASGVERQQIKWGLLGFAASILLYAATTFCQAWLNAAPGPETLLTLYGSFLCIGLGTLALPLGMTVALLRFRLYDAEAAISRSVAYGALTLTLLAIFAGTEKIIEALGEEYFGAQLGALAGGIGAALAAVMIAPLHHRINHWAEHRFQKGLIKLRHGLPLLVGDMRETASLTALAEAVLKRVETGVRPKRIALLDDTRLVVAHDVDDSTIAQWRAGWTPPAGEHLDCKPADPLFPMRVPLAADGIGTVGWLLRGPRPDGSFYGKDEREVLSEIADPIARAIAIVRDREAHQGEIQGRFSAIESKFAQIEAALLRLMGGTPLAAE
ncbi:hypothetical protein BH09PSE4_BH09PSE4_08030 [soil metagenome]